MISDPEKIIEAYESGRIRKVLLIRISRMGDLLFTTPAVRGLKARFPEAELHYLANAYSASVLKGNPHIARIHLFERKSLLWKYLKMSPAIKKLKWERFDLAVPFRWRDEYVTLFRKIAVPFVYRLSGALESEEDQVHQADRHLEGLEPLGVEPDGRGMEVYPDGGDEEAIIRFMEDKDLKDAPLIVFHPGSHQIIRSGPITGAAKRVWPVEAWAGLAKAVYNRLGVPPVLTAGSKGDMECNREILRLSSVPCPFFTEKGTGRLAALFRRASAFVCGDTGPLHVASAAGVPTVALFGPSRPAVTGPYRNPGNSRVIQKDLHCSPCKGRKIKCTFNECMHLITPMEVYNALFELVPAVGVDRNQ